MLTVGVGQAREGRYAEVMATLRGGETVLEGVPFQESLRTRLREERHLAERGQLADQLHAVYEQVRPLYAAEVLSRTQRAKAEPSCRE